MRAITDAVGASHAGAFAFGGGVELGVSVTAELVTPDDFLALMCDARFLRTSKLTGVIGDRYFYTLVVPEDIYSDQNCALLRKALGL